LWEKAYREGGYAGRAEGLNDIIWKQKKLLVSGETRKRKGSEGGEKDPRPKKGAKKREDK